MVTSLEDPICLEMLFIILVKMVINYKAPKVGNVITMDFGQESDHFVRVRTDLKRLFFFLKKVLFVKDINVIYSRNTVQF